MNILKNHWTVHLKYSVYTKNHWIVYLKIQFIYTLNCTACVLYLNKDAKEENMEDKGFLGILKFERQNILLLPKKTKTWKIASTNQKILWGAWYNSH